MLGSRVPSRLSSLAVASAFALGCAATPDADADGDSQASEVREDPAARPLADAAELARIVASVRARVYPELADYRVSLVPFTNDADYFRADIEASTVLRSGKKRNYRLLYNTRIFEDAPPVRAVEAIVVHELKHIRDYTKRSSVGFLFWALGYALCSDNSKYERQTDRYALEHDFGAGLKAYRNWLYAHVSAETRAAKRKTYYTPEEIDAYLAGHPPPLEPLDPTEGRVEALGEDD